MTISTSIVVLELGLVGEMGSVAGETAHGFAVSGVLLAAGGMVYIGVIDGLLLVAAEAGLLNLAPGKALGFASVGCVASGTQALHDGLVPGGGFFREDA